MRKHRTEPNTRKETIAAIVRQSGKFFVARTAPQGRVRIGELGVRCVTSNLPSFHEFAVDCLRLGDDVFEIVCASYLNDAFPDREARHATL